MKTKKSFGYPVVPLKKRVMILVKYDSYPYMLVHQAVKESDQYTYVSGWFAGHQRLGYWEIAHQSLLAVLTIKDGEKLKKELEQLTGEHRTMKDCIHEAYIAKRDTLLLNYPVRRYRRDK